MRRHILILVENESVPRDRRVWQESQALTSAGFKVTVICPTGSDRDREREAVIEGVRILRYPLRAANGGPLGYLRERVAMVLRPEHVYGSALAHAATGDEGAPRGPYRHRPCV